MKFDAPMVMMLGIAGLGAFAIYKLTQAKGSSPQTTTTSAIDLAGQPIAALKLTQGARYEGRLSLQPLDIPPLASTREQLAQFIQLLGFRNVKVYMTPSELPSGWSELRSGSSASRWFEATWPNPSATVPRPQQVDRLSSGGTALIAGMTG